MRLLILLSTLISAGLFIGCGDACTDSIVTVSTDFEEWFPYEEGNQDATFVDTSAVSTTYSLVRDNDPIIEEDGGCQKTFDRPFIQLRDKSTSTIFYNIWFESSELVGQEGGIRMVGTFSYIDSLENTIIANNGFEFPNFDDLGGEVVLAGESLSDVVEFPFLRNGEVKTTAYIQKNKGLIAFEENGNLQIIN